MLGRPKTGPDWSALNAACETLISLFEETGAVRTSLPHLFDAETLLDLYGEDLRARAFLFADAERGNELCLRPDFTVPTALAHAQSGWDRQASYAYAGPVFRRQPQGMGRPVEYTQVGVERFGDTDTTAADAQLCLLLRSGLTALDVVRPDITMGDLSIAFALLDTLDMPDRRRAALRRHVWRPKRFQSLIDAAVAPSELSSNRRKILSRVDNPHATKAAISAAGELVGVRDVQDISNRLDALARDARDPGMPRADADLIASILAVRGPAPQAARDLRTLAGGLSKAMTAALDRFDERLDAFAKEGLDPVEIHFDASFGRNLEYYDGVVFEMRANGDGDHPPLAGGGRYDAMTVQLGASAAVPAIGGILRPETILGTLA
ncbi:MAG: ATP phosphoribosyltransferase regulatory subunit [Pseudomonadota bacterium]